MRLLLLHLSDLHLANGVGLPPGAMKAMAMAARALDSLATECIVCITGDIAFSGSPREYEQAATLFSELSNALQSAARFDTVRFIMTPGNHDCDFTKDNALRDLVVRSFGECAAVDEHIVATCTGVQDHFFRFRSAYLDNAEADRLCHVQTIVVGKYRIAFRCINTAWLSVLKERQGSLAFPVDYAKRFDGALEGADLVISLFHHPYSWLEDSNAREFRRYIEHSSDIVLTGHEHDQDTYTVLRGTGDTHGYLEGGVLYGRGATESSFNAIVLDTRDAKMRVFRLRWEADGYYPEQEEPAWQALGRMKGPYELRESFLKKLTDPGVAFSHPRKADLTLSDIFVYPSLAEISDSDKTRSKLIKADAVFDAISGNDQLAIIGPEKSGKTTLAKVLFMTLFRKGLVPVLFDGSELREYDVEALKAPVKREFEAQYQVGSWEQYQQLELTRKAIIVDDYHLSKLNAKGRRRQLAALHRIFGTVIVFGTEVLQVEGASSGAGDESSLISFRFFQIKPLGYYQRSQLIERWILLGQECELSERDLLRERDQTERATNVVIGNNFVPAYPLFVLTILQTLETGKQVDVSHGSYGFLYQVLIQGALSGTGKRLDDNTKEAFLSYLAYEMHLSGSRTITEERYNQVHRSYCEIYREVPLEYLTKALVESRLLEYDEHRGIYRFRYKYAYYYFVANYISLNISDKAIRRRISEIVAKLHVEENANIAMFLSYLCSDQILLEEMLIAAMSIFEDVEPCDLETDIQFTKQLDAPIRQLALEDRAPRENRDRLLARKDALERVRAEEDDEDFDVEEEIDDIAKVNMAWKSIEVMGQLARSFPGSLRKNVKVEIVSECYNLGLRTLKVIFGLVENNLDALANYRRDQLPELEREKQIKAIRRFIYSILQGLTYVTAKLISYSVGTESLADVYRETRLATNTLPCELIDFTIRLQHFETFPRKQMQDLLKRVKSNPFVEFIVQYLVFEYLYMNPVNPPLKQQICHEAGISLKSATIARHRALGQ